MSCGMDCLPKFFCFIASTYVKYLFLDLHFHIYFSNLLLSALYITSVWHREIIICVTVLNNVVLTNQTYFKSYVTQLTLSNWSCVQNLDFQSFINH